MVALHDPFGSCTLSPMNDIDVRDLLRLTLTPGIGPVLIGRLIEAYGSARDGAKATRSELQRIDKIGPKKADQIAEGLARAESLVEEELTLADSLGVRFIARDDAEYLARLGLARA